MTLEEIKSRHSVRSYIARPLSDSDISYLRSELTMINTHEAGIHFKLITNNSEPLKKFNKSYGFFRNASNFIAAVVDYSYPDVVERAGFFAENVVLKATCRGLGTCFVGGMYNRTAAPVALRAGQELLFIITVGYEETLVSDRPLAKIAMKIAHFKKRSISDFFVERGEWTLGKALKQFPYLKKGLEAIASAPSSLNKQPFRLWVGKKDDANVIRIGIPNISDRQFIDLGIAKCNFAEVANGYFDWGNGAAFYTNE